jgi:hypothetical protein
MEPCALNELPRRRCKRPEARPPVLEVVMPKVILT